MNYHFDDRNFLVSEKVTVAKISVDAFDNRTKAETNLQMLITVEGKNVEEACREKAKEICRELGYTAFKIGAPMTRSIDLNTLS